ncbi:uncharacterized protein N0V89_010209 [Didymosphaeria variabile]|uniref:Uncharacterized protein n=1 Tax=Didymosphaeria variabile TaxID=1932322 RepID=A0A9W8XGK6_9PLEO|nr:uncharacterized protein N0V89_010209 [Didymosphaeria variabile]KAJ4348831.1 hypothetical protein N0V89_010209 [Didymosphaeria variabile]
MKEVDKKIDGSVGKFGNHYEVVLDTNREVPVFEFRDLFAPRADEFGQAVKKVEDAIVGYHRKFANGPRKFRRRQDAKYSHIRRNAPRDDCAAPTPADVTTTTAPSTTPPPTISCELQHEDPDQGINQMGCICGSTTLPLLTVTDATIDWQSCDYTVLPTSSIANPISIEHQTYMANCYLCTLIGGIADTPSCATQPVDGCTPTTPAVPTATVFLSNNSVPIGDENNKNNGADLRTDLFNKLKALCPDNASTCDSKTPAEFDNIETVTGDEPVEETIKFVIQDSHYDSGQERDQMIAAAVASWQQGVAKSCKEVEYEDTEDLTASGCGTGIVKRGSVLRALMTPEERRATPWGTPWKKRSAIPEPICDNCDPPPAPECHYKATICSGPDHIGGFSWCITFLASPSICSDSAYYLLADTLLPSPRFRQRAQWPIRKPHGHPTRLQHWPRRLGLERIYL